MVSFNQTVSRSQQKGQTASRRLAGPWKRAMDRFSESLRELDEVGNAQTAAEEAMFAARRALEEVQPPSSLKGEVTVELYFNDGVSTPVLRRYTDNIDLHDEEAIENYARGDAEIRSRLLNELRTWQERRSSLERAFAEARDLEKAADRLFVTALSKSDASQLRVLRTPAPSLRELHWKIAKLRKQDCGDYTENAGWEYVLAELAQLAAGDAEGGAALN